MSSFWVRSRNFLRVRNIELGYSFRHHAKFRAAGISDYRIDPELLSYRYPVLKSYNIGVNLTF